jgi:hypothetical protein
MIFWASKWLATGDPDLFSDHDRNPKRFDAFNAPKNEPSKARYNPRYANLERRIQKADGGKKCTEKSKLGLASAL